MKTPLDSRQLRAFCVLARTGSFTETARELHLTQSGINHSMKALECGVGCRLLYRLGKEAVLALAGGGIGATQVFARRMQPMPVKRALYC